MTGPIASFDGQVALVTGGGSGIGASVSKALARAGAKVAVCDISQDAAEHVAREIGAGALAIVVDISDSDSVASMVQRTIDRFGRLDVAVNNAGIGGSGQFCADISEDHFDRVMAINLKGVWQCMRYELPALLETGGGAIVNMASALGLVARAGSAAYIAAKHGVIGLTKAAAVEYSARGIRVNAVCPGVIETPLIQSRTTDPSIVDELKALHPIGRLGLPDEVANAVLWLASSQASFVTGVAVPVDGGWTAQ